MLEYIKNNILNLLKTECITLKCLKPQKQQQ